MGAEDIINYRKTVRSVKSKNLSKRNFCTEEQNNNTQNNFFHFIWELLGKVNTSKIIINAKEYQLEIQKTVHPACR